MHKFVTPRVISALVIGLGHVPSISAAPKVTTLNLAEVLDNSDSRSHAFLYDVSSAQ